MPIINADPQLVCKIFVMRSYVVYVQSQCNPKVQIQAKIFSQEVVLIEVEVLVQLQVPPCCILPATWVENTFS